MAIIRNKFLKKVSIYFLGTLSTKVIYILIVPIYAYFVLAEELGEYDYAIAIAAIITPIVYMVIWESILKYCIKIRETKDLNDYLSTTFVFFVCITIFLVMIGLCISFFYKNTVELVLIISFVITQGAVSIWQFTARALGENKRYVIAGIIGSAILVISNVFLVVIFRLNYLGLSISHLVSQFAIIAVLESKTHLIRRYKMLNISMKKLREMLAFSIPLVINNISLWAYSSGNKVIIRNFLGATENGLYSFAARFSMLISLFSTVISMAVIEEAYSFDTLEDYKNEISKLLAIISKGYFSLIILALPLIYLIYTIAFENTEYNSSSDYVFLLLLSALFTALSNNFGSSFQVTNNTKYISITTISGGVVAIAISLLLVKPLGVYGVLIGGAVGPFVMMLMRAIYAKRTTGLKLKWSNNIFILIASILAYYILVTFKSLNTQIIMLVSIIAFLIFVYRTEIRVIKNKLQSMKGE